MLSMVSRIIITTHLILSPPKTLVSTYLRYMVVQVAGYGIVALGHYLLSMAVPLFHLGMFVFGIGRGTFSFPYLILVRTFDRPSDAFAIVLWLTLGVVGNNWGIFLQAFMEDTLKWPWHVALFVFSVVAFLTAALTFVLVPEEYLPEEQMGVCEYAGNMASILKVYY